MLRGAPTTVWRTFSKSEDFSSEPLGSMGVFLFDDRPGMPPVRQYPAILLFKNRAVKPGAFPCRRRGRKIRDLVPAATVDRA